MNSIFNNDKNKGNQGNNEQTNLGVERRITIRGPKLGDTQTIIISPNGTEIKVIKGSF